MFVTSRRAWLQNNKSMILILKVISWGLLRLIRWLYQTITSPVHKIDAQWSVSKELRNEADSVNYPQGQLACNP